MKRSRFDAHPPLLILLMFLGSISASPERAVAQNFDREPADQRLTVPADREILQALDEARRAVERKQFHNAVQLLQSVLDGDEDYFVGRDFRSDKDGNSGVKAEALKLLKTMPAEGRAAYELEYGTAARDEFAAARDDDDYERMATVARRYSLTNAGFDVVLLLAARASDCNRPLEAALLLETLRDHPAAPQKWTPQLLLRLASCWNRAAQTERSIATLKELKRIVPGNTLKIAGRDVALFTRDDEAFTWLSSQVGPSIRPTESLVDSWTMIGGGPTRNESAAPASPVGGDRWRVSLFEHLAYDGRGETNQQRRTQLEQILAKEQLALRDEARIAIPAAQPLVVSDTVVYRTISEITAVSLRTGDLLWRSALTDGTLIRLWNSRNMETRGGEVLDVNAAISRSLATHVRRRLFRDSTAGSLSSDGHTVFALEELDPIQTQTSPLRGGGESAIGNKLVAYDLTGGKMLWEVGGPRGAKPVELSGHYFLGPPLPLDGRLYCLAESQGELRLIVLEQQADRTAVRLDWAQTLIATDRPVTHHPPRRLSGLSPTFADGILICPTSSGAVVAVDAIRRVLLWGHQYRTIMPAQIQDPRIAMFQRGNPNVVQVDELDETARWLDATAMIANGRVIVTPRDADELQCLDLLDGRLLWKLPRGEWLYPACIVDGRVVMVGRDGLAAFQLDDGKPIDSFVTTSVEPAGRGLRVGTHYFLPLANGEIATIDLSSGRIIARSKLSEGSLPGNLIAGSGAIVSQSAGELIAFARLPDVERQIAEELKKDPQQRVALALRGELRLHRGDEEGGLKDLRSSLSQRPDPRVKSVLAAALLAGLRGNPQLIRERAAELETLTDDPQQRNEFLRIYARALEESGDRRGAFAQLIRLAETAEFLSDLQTLNSSHSVRTDRAIRARLIEMYNASSPEDRTALDEILSRRIESVEQGTDLSEHLDRSLRFFAGLPRVERLLFEQIASIEGAAHPEALLERFAQSNDPSVAARATALLAQELLQANRPSAAIPWIKLLHERFAEQQCLNDQTGQSLSDQWRAREDIQSLLNVASIWTAGSIDVSRKSRETANRAIELTTEFASRDGTLFEGWSFDTDATFRALTARDANGRVRWKATIPPDAAHNDIVGRNLLIPVQVHQRGRWLAVTIGTYFVMYEVTDPDQAPRVAWQQTLRSAGTTAADVMFGQRNIQVRVLPNGRAIPMGMAANGRLQGQFVGMTREIALYVIGQKLCAAELDTGRLAWSRQDVIPGRADISADDRAITIVPNATRELILLRPLDGTDLARRKLEPDEISLWIHGAQHVLTRLVDNQLIVELRDLEQNKLVWSRTHQTGAQLAVVDAEDVAVLEPTGTLTVAQIANGQTRYQAELPGKDSTWMAIQRQIDRDIVLFGNAAKSTNGARVMPYESSQGNAFTFDGHVCGISRAEGKLLWATAVEQVIYDPTQPTGLPVLLLSARSFDPRQAAMNPFGNRYRLSASVIDKRTGRLLYSTQENAPALPPRLEPDPDHRRVIANFYDWQLELTFPEPKAAAPPVK